ncbi:MAG: response regulator transcription factor [Bdellovibrionaceae bacterium]|nr:response regulator transcription factor [Pseudobdellovibrionaceae bacterium]
MHILLAEDDPAVSIVTRMCLEKIGGHTVELAADGAEAVDCATRRSYDLIILDGMMPLKSGLQAAQEIRAAGIVTTPIIFLSAKIDDRDVASFLSVGTGFIPKPFEPTEICARIDDILANPPTSAPQGILNR